MICYGQILTKMSRVGERMTGVCPSPLVLMLLASSLTDMTLTLYVEHTRYCLWVLCLLKLKGRKKEYFLESLLTVKLSSLWTDWLEQIV